MEIMAGRVASVVWDGVLIRILIQGWAVQQRTDTDNVTAVPRYNDFLFRSQTFTGLKDLNRSENARHIVHDYFAGRSLRVLQR